MQLEVGNKTGELPGLEHDRAVLHAVAGRVYVAGLLGGVTDHTAARRYLAQLGRAVADAITARGSR